MTAYFIDRRLNPKGKSLANRQRFLRRARAQIREAVQKTLKDSEVADAGKDRKVRISNQGTREPRFRLDPPRVAIAILFCPATRISSPATRSRNRSRGRAAGSGKDAATSGEMEDDFEFTMREDEILDIFFEDLELPESGPHVAVRRADVQLEARGHHHGRRAQSDQSASHNAKFVRPQARTAPPVARRHQGARGRNCDTRGRGAAASR